MRFSSPDGPDQEEHFTALGSSTEKTLAIPPVKELPEAQVIWCYPVLILLLPMRINNRFLSAVLSHGEGLCWLCTITHLL